LIVTVILDFGMAERAQKNTKARPAHRKHNARSGADLFAASNNGG
jgi:hypothetical protein